MSTGQQQFTRRSLARNFPWSEGHVPTSSWEFSTNTPGELSTVARFQAPRPIWLREDRELSLVVPAYETKTVDDTADNSETFKLSHNLLESPATNNIVVYDDGTRVSGSALTVDYAADSFDYSSPNTGTTLDIYYVPRDPATVKFKKTAPGGGASFGQDLFSIPTAIAHTRDQIEEPLSFDLNRTELQPFVPRKWEVVMQVKADYTVKFEEPTRGTEATNALLSLPREQTENRIPGLKDAVKADIAELS
ncbi:hypothetical protein [Halorubellus litoreus]|uniref:Uncharacterized protein n=1 Tax=Halorubellus litoreus TaxID=755308 RepID=A0ABD5VA96_9EURY